MSRRKARGPAPTCDSCGLHVVFLRVTWADAYRPFGSLPIDPVAALVPNAHPSFGGRVWLLEELVEELMVRTAQSREDATDEAYALPWYVAHTCRPPINEERSR